MKIPTHWSKATVEEPDRDGRKTSFSCWRWSDRSQEDAHESALAAAKRILQSIVRGDHLDRYAYGEVPLREEVIERFTNSRAELFAAVTRNAYGSLILNTTRVLFIDLDFPPTSFGEHLRYFFTKLFSKSARSPDAQRESDVTTRLEQFLSSHLHWNVRLYRTCAGSRALVTQDLFDPNAGTTLDILHTLGSDPLYVRLCKAQECFRARLTPKPWRCGHTANAARWPRENEHQEERFNRWLAGYTASQSGYATCRFLGTLGNGSVHPEIQGIIDVHDKITRCHERLDLA